WLWDVPPGEETARPRNVIRRVSALHVGADGTILAAEKVGNSITVSDAATGRQRSSLAGHAGPVNAVHFCPDGRTLIAAIDAEKSAKLWDVETGRQRAALAGYVGSACFSPDAKSMASWEDGTLRVWDVTTGEEHRPLARAVGGVAFSPDGRTLA